MNSLFSLQCYFYSSIFTASSSILLGLFVLYKSPRNLVNQTWFLLSLSVAGWSYFLNRTFFAANSTDALFAARACNIIASYIPLFFLHFCKAITLDHRQNYILIIGYINSFIFTLLGFTTYFCGIQSISIFPYYVAARPLYHYFTFHFFFYFIYSEFILLRYLKTVSHEKKNQITYIIIATNIGFVTGGLTFLPAYGIPINPVSAHFIWLYAAVISFAIVKHGLMDISIIIRKGLIYSTLITIITCLYFVAVYIISFSFQHWLGYKSFIQTLLIVTAITVFFKPLERRVQKAIDMIFFNKSPEILAFENQKLLDEVQKQDHMKSVATLAAGMAHEIKNPLTSIKTFAEYLPEKYEDAEFRDKFKRIVVDEVDRVNNIVKQLLEFAKPQEPELKRLSINTILDETIELLNSNLLNHRIRVVKNYTQDQKISADKSQLKQAFLNLFLNSIQAMPDGGTLTICTSLTTDYRLLTTITDSGEGIPEGDLKHVLDPFFTTREDGTGLGLSIVHGIITKHGGKLEIKSHLGAGTTVSVILKS